MGCGRRGHARLGRCAVSVEAISWALNLAPVPADRGGRPSSACRFVLVGLANHAGADGTGAFPSVATLVRYTGVSERTVRTCWTDAPAELPSAQRRRPAQPPWCGEYDQATRMLGFDSDTPHPCPRCKPSAAARRTACAANGRL